MRKHDWKADKETHFPESPKKNLQITYNISITGDVINDSTIKCLEYEIGKRLSDWTFYSDDNDTGDGCAITVESIEPYKVNITEL